MSPHSSNHESEAGSRGDGSGGRRAAPPRAARPASDLSIAAASQRSALTRNGAIAIQRTAGNQALAAMLSAQRPPARQVQRVGTIISAPAKKGTSAHPTLQLGGTNNQEAVEEAQQKLATSPKGPTALTANGIFDADTEKAAKAFQKRWGLTEDGIIGKNTWKKLDAKGKSSVGRVERTWQQTLLPGSEGGKSQVQGMTSKYSYRIDDAKIAVSVGINFVADSTHPPADLSKVVAKWTGRILQRWNQFKAVKQGKKNKDSRDIVFAIVPSGGNTVTVTDEDTGSDAGTWSVPDNENDNGPAHEFGHMIGLEDEYKRNMEDYTRLHPGISSSKRKKAKGAFFGGKQYTDEVSMMGTGALSKHDDKAADPEPRHVREFVGFVEKFLGGKWEAEKK
jgi:peptidoglycan hydrolase-like protein with peptidoglycan-binding domain